MIYESLGYVCRVVSHQHLLCEIIMSSSVCSTSSRPVTSTRQTSNNDLYIPGHLYNELFGPGSIGIPRNIHPAAPH
jgi:hypothetical protein